MEEIEEAGHEPAVEFAACAADAGFFIDQYCVIDDAQGDGEGGGVMPFRLWPAQVELIDTLQTERLLVILKARQLGISWLAIAYGLWLALFWPGKVILLFSQGEREAKEMLRRVKALYDRLPDWLRRACPGVVRDVSEEFGFANGSMIRSLPSSKRAGRSFTASLVVLDEAAHQPFAQFLYRALKPTIDNGRGPGNGQLVVLSSANGLGNLFHQIWVKARKGVNRFRTVFLPWWSRPGRDAAWYQSQVAESPDPDLVPQEYPSSPEEAFIASGRLRFRGEWIAAQSAYDQEPIAYGLLPPDLQAIEGLEIYELPEDLRGRPLVLAADVAEGLEHGDYDAAVVIDQRTWREVARLHGHWPADMYAQKLAATAEAYQCPIVIERNNHGHSVLLALRLAGCERIAEGHDERAGWLTNAQTKPIAIDALAAALRDGLVQVRSASTRDELLQYEVKHDGSTGAPSGSHDDEVMAWAIALGWLKLCNLDRSIGRAPNPLAGWRGR